MIHSSKERMAIYTIYDRDGIVDRYVLHFLKGLKKVADRIVIVANGHITPESQHALQEITSEIRVRKNNGFDVFGYRHGLNYVGWDDLKKYYEVILVNDTLFGPVYPFEEMFSEMEKKDVDFWGISENPGYEDFDPLGTNPYGYMPRHVQSFFTVYRNSLLNSKDLKEYWEKIPDIKTYNDAVGKHETYATKWFSDRGYNYGVYLDDPELEEYTPYALMAMPKTAIEIYRCPVFKKRSFFMDADYLYTYTAGEATVELMKYLETETCYDTSMIWENILRVCHQDDIARAMGHAFVLPKSNYPDFRSTNRRVALIMHLYYMDILESSLKYASAMPEYADIYITTSTADKAEMIEKAFAEIPNKVEVRVVGNRGRSESALLVGCADVISNYDYVCFFHDKKTTQNKPYSIGRSFAYLISEGVLASREYVENVIALFESKPKLGLLCPLFPSHGPFFATFSCEWSENFENTCKLAKDLGLSVPMSENKLPVAPMGGVFWFRTDALKKLFNYGWKYSDFPEEPIRVDGTLLHAIERVYPFVVQDAGYYPAYVSSDEFAGIEFSEYIYYLRWFSKICVENGIVGTGFSIISQLEQHVGYYEERCMELERQVQKLIPQTSLKAQLRIRLKRFVPRKIYGAIVKVKRMIFGPHDIGYSYDENWWEN